MPLAPSGVVLYENPSCELMVTTKCNMQCSYCIARNLPKLDMTKEIGIKAIEYFIYLAEGAKVLDFIFTGGEPLLDFDTLEYLIEYAVTKTNDQGMGATISIKTNGTLIQNQHLGLFKKYKCTLFVSIDGMAQDHNRHRAPNEKQSYDQVIRNIKLLLNNDIYCIASMTVHPDSARNVFNGFVELIGNGFLRINIAPAYGTVDWTHYDVDSFKQAMIEIAQFIRDNKRNYPGIDIGPIYRNTEHINNILMESWGCNAGSSNIAVLPNGDIAGCSSLAMMANVNPDLIIGNVITGLQQTKVSNLIREAKADCSSRNNCEHCTSKNDCSGGCLAINYSTNGKAFDPPSIYCESISTIQNCWNIAWGEPDV
jgi:uncharacterized protein